MALRGRLLLAFLVPTFIVLALGGWLFFQASRNTLEDELGRSLSDIAAAVSSQLKGERVLAMEAADAQGDGSRTYKSLIGQLQEAKTRTGVRRIFVVDVESRARLDVGGPLTPMVEATELLRDSGELKRVFAGEKAASQVLFEGKDGQLYKTGYAPLLQEGKVVGAVAVEGSAAFFGPLATIGNTFLVLSIIGLGVLAIVAVVLARGLAQPLERLVAAALRIGEGDLSTSVRAEASLEIGLLARELESMRVALESRDRQLKLMLGGVAHEVKNPLGGIELFSGLLDEELASKEPNVPDAREHLTKIRRELEYLKRIVEDFLAFAKERKLQTAPFPAKSLLQNATEHLAGEATGKNVSLVVESEDATLEGDLSLLTSALVNLVKNAVQISNSGQRVSVKGARHGSHYAIEVRDEGPGIAADKQAQVFEPFFTTREKGTGLGLPLARKLAEAHKGTLTLRSKPGETVFTLSLPSPSGRRPG
ncbi:MAG: HAMP domain-containing histidine kinase [Archangium sp.]|nr:HAMP domain-containing histidine kinase [Archangium sp.]